MDRSSDWLIDWLIDKQLAVTWTGNSFLFVFFKTLSFRLGCWNIFICSFSFSVHIFMVLLSTLCSVVRNFPWSSLQCEHIWLDEGFFAVVSPGFCHQYCAIFFDYIFSMAFTMKGVFTWYVGTYGTFYLFIHAGPAKYASIKQSIDEQLSHV